MRPLFVTPDPLDLDCFVADFIDALPTDATFRGNVITVRFGEAPRTREMMIAGFKDVQGVEILMKAADAGETEPAPGETITVNDVGYKIGTVTPLVSLSDPAGYRLTISRLV